MSTVTDDLLTIDDFDDEIARGARGLTFSPPIERLFLDEYLRHRARMVPLWASLGTVMYLAAILGDLSMIPELAWLVVTLRLAIFVPFAVGVVVLMRLRPTPATYDLLSFGVGLIAICIPMITLVFARSDHLFVYQTGSVGTLAFFVIVLRPRFLTVLIGLAVLMIIQLVTTKLNGSFDAVTYSGMVTFYITLGVFLALSAYFTEHVDRQNFLNRQRSEVLHSKLKKLSETDPMTGLSNRHVLERVKNTFWSPSSGGRIISAVMLDIDNFKLFNDINGHLAGDACIRDVSQRIRQIVGKKGTVFRYGGEEILVLLPDIDNPEAVELADSIRRSIAGLGIVHEGSPHGVVTASLGVATIRTDRCSAEDLLLRTDVALYEAKEAGRNNARAWSGQAVPFRVFTAESTPPERSSSQ